ncbi:MAG: pseudouridine synthase [Chromatiales bacterium]|nr:pseudouridine synthase [Chromatiales bacterium]
MRRPGRRPTTSSRSRPARAAAAPAAAERLQKVLAGAGVASRREIEEWIRAARITVDGKPATLGQRVSGRERISIDGKPVAALRRPAARARTLIYHKPSGEICSRHDPEQRPTVFERLPPVQGGRWVSVGRLDFTTSGLLLLTTDGALAHALMHPSSGLEREYMVRILGAVDEATLQRLRDGLQLEDGPARFDVLEAAGGGETNRWFRVLVKEGRNRLVRRLWEAAGCQVSRLIRVRYGPVVLPRDLRTGRHRLLEGEGLQALYAAAGLAGSDAQGPAYWQSKVPPVTPRLAGPSRKR